MSASAAQQPEYRDPEYADPGYADPVCSAKGCAEPALWSLLWNNPKIHSEQRRKQWLACDTHRVTLDRFLSARGFLRETRPLA